MNPPAVGTASIGRAAIPCGQPFREVSTLDLKSIDRLLSVQAQLDAQFETTTATVAGQIMPTLEYFRHLRSLCAMLVYVGQPEDLGELPEVIRQAFTVHVENREFALQQRHNLHVISGGRGGPTPAAYRSAPQSASLMAAILPTAVELLNETTTAGLKSKLNWLVQRLHARNGKNVRRAVTDFKLTAPLLTAFDDCLAPRAEFDRRFGVRSTKTPIKGYFYTATHIPQLLWLDDYRRDFQPLLATSDITESGARRALSVMLLRLSVPASWGALAGALDLPNTTGTGIVNKVLGVINGVGRAEEFDMALHALATRLSNQPDKVDYGKRRDLLRDFRIISSEAWVWIAMESKFQGSPSIGRRRNGAAWAWATITEGDPYLSPALSKGNRESLREMYRRFIKNDLYKFSSGLDRYAKGFLATLEKK